MHYFKHIIILWLLLQRLRCKCNYHALKFVPKIQETGSLLIRRIRKYDGPRNKLDKELLGNFIIGPSNGPTMDREPLKYIALHMRFEIDMVAYSLCEFGGGQDEKTELQTYREIHFPLLMQRLKESKWVMGKGSTEWFLGLASLNQNTFGPIFFKFCYE